MVKGSFILSIDVGAGARGDFNDLVPLKLSKVMYIVIF